jgi:hypothetical protein
LLIAANLVPVYGVLALDWEVFPLVLLFWTENVVIGVFSVLRMLAARPAKEEHGATKLFLVPFFAVHYGMFTLVHGVFVFALFSGGRGDSIRGPFELGSLASRSLGDLDLTLPVLALVASHAFSFGVNYLAGGEYRRTTLRKLMIRPYGRIVVLHLAILGSGFLVHTIGSPQWGLLLLIVLKIALDLRAHLRANASSWPTEPVRTT